MKKALIAAGVVALMFAGVASAHEVLRHTFRLNPGACRVVGHVRVCAKHGHPKTSVRAVTAPPVTVTITKTVTVAPPTPTPAEQAEQYVARVTWAAEASDPTRPKGEIVALAAMNYVADNHVNLFMRSYLKEHGGIPSLKTANEMLAAEAGLCGNAADVFATIVRHFGYQVRSVAFYYADPPGTQDGHTAAEVYYDGGWHYFDPTFSLYWRDASTGNVLDIGTARAGGGVEHKNNELLFNVIENPRDPGGGGVSDSWFELDPTTTVQLDLTSLDG